MKGFYSIIKYYPDINRDEGFGIGLHLISEDQSFNKIQFSEKRIKRINNAYNLKKTFLLESTLNDFKQTLLDKNKIDYLSVYSNGMIRFTKPQIIVTESFDEKFPLLYNKFIADYSEDGFDSSSENLKRYPKYISNKFRSSLKSNSVIEKSLDIGYEFKEIPLLLGNPKIDYIGVNGKIYAGEIFDFEQTDESVQKNFNKTITLFDAFEKLYPENFEPSECKFLVLTEQAKKKEYNVYMDVLNSWNTKAQYGILIKDSLEDFHSVIESDVSTMNIKKFKKWSDDLKNIKDH